MPWTPPPPPAPTLSIGEADGVTVARAALAIRGRHATLTLVLTSATRTVHEVSVPLAIPRTAAVTGMVVVEQDHRTIAIASTPMRASDRYEATVNRVIDPVLLEHAPDGDTRQQDQLAALPGGPPGLRTATEIRDGIRRNIATLVHCAEVDPTPRALGFLIAADGTVSDVVGADACIADEIRRWRFAPAREATHIRYPVSWDVAAP